MAIEVMGVIFIGLMCIGVGLYYHYANHPITIYNQTKPPQENQLTDMKCYNHAVSKLLFGYGMSFLVIAFLLVDDPFLCMIIGILMVMPGIVVVCYLYEKILQCYTRK